ncbi:MAG: iron ABC transporter permease [Lachnospiraceae bacterium]|jgi:iron complex transport system permease protein|nr:iron ABC transporter permease [Lachnospiraceae bacterium]
MENRRFRLFATAGAFIALTVALAWLNVALGSVRAADADIIFKIRLPRLLASAILGGALALSGFLLQSFLGNPIAGPFVLGISHGSKLAVAFVMICVLRQGAAMSSQAMVGAAFLGAMAVTGMILLFSRGAPHPGALIVCGVMVGYLCSAATDFLTAFADEAGIVNLHNWSRGSFSGTSWDNVWQMAALTAGASICAFMLSKPLAAYQMGEQYAKSVGVDVLRLRVCIVALSSLLCATVTAYAGPISFVGIAAPHIVKSLLKNAKPILVIPFCFWCGMIFCMGCDLIARTAFAPTELYASSVTAIVGAPVVIKIMLERKGRR